MSIINPVNGRPTKSRQLEIERLLRPYFEKGISATTTSTETGINVKTICRYYNKWYLQIVDTEEKDFATRQKMKMEQVTLTLERQLLNLFEMENLLQKHIKSKKGGSKRRYKIILKLEGIVTVCYRYQIT